MPKSLFSDAYAEMIRELVAARKTAGMSQVDLAGALRKDQSFVSKIETGVRRLDVIEFCAIVRALGQDPTAVFERVLRRLPKRLEI